MIVDDPLHGIRIDVTDGDWGGDISALVFELAVTDRLPLQLVELRRLFGLLRRTTLAVPKRRQIADRCLLALRTIDALAEGASLRMIGEALVRPDDWPGAGESTKSKARRLVAGARMMWGLGPKGPLGGSA